jgi:hypothetical protein
MLKFPYELIYNAIKEDLQKEITYVSYQAKKYIYSLLLHQEKELQKEIETYKSCKIHLEKKQKKMILFYNYTLACDKEQGNIQDDVIIKSTFNILYNFLILDTSTLLKDDSLIYEHIRNSTIACFWISYKFHIDDDKGLYSFELEKFFKVNYNIIVMYESNILNTLSFNIYKYMTE